MKTMGEMDTLIQENEKLVFYTLQKYFPMNRFDDDYIQEGRIALWEALRDWTPDMSISFSTYAVVGITNRIHNYYRNHIRRDVEHLVRGRAVQDGEDDNTDVGLSEDECTDYTPEHMAVIRDGLNRAEKAMTPHQRQIYHMMEMGYSQVEIARKFGVTKNAVGKNVGRIRKVIREQVLAS